MKSSGCPRRSARPRSRSSRWLPGLTCAASGAFRSSSFFISLHLEDREVLGVAVGEVRVVVDAPVRRAPRRRTRPRCTAGRGICGCAADRVERRAHLAQHLEVDGDCCSGAGPPSGPYTRHGTKRAPLVWKDTKSRGARGFAQWARKPRRNSLPLRPGPGRPSWRGHRRPHRAARPSPPRPSRRTARGILPACRASRRCRARSTAPTASPRTSSAP